MLAGTVLATSNATQSNTLPNSLPNLVGENIGGTDCPYKEDDEEMSPLKNTELEDL